MSSEQMKVEGSLKKITSTKEYHKSGDEHFKMAHSGKWDTKYNFF